MFWSGYNLIFQAIAILLTYFIVTSDFDWKFFEFTRIIPTSVYFPAIIMGGLLPIFIPIFFLGYGNAKNDKSISLSGVALGQSAIIGLLISGFYKIFTGRIQPNLYNTVTDISKEFNFGFMRHGVFWGWPSSHTTVAFAMAITLIYLYPKNKALIVLSLIYAFYVGIAVSMSIHWFSEFVAGAIFGTIIGMIVGKTFADYKKTSA